MIHFCTKSDPPPVLILLPTMEVFGQKPSDKQKGRQTGKAKTGINQCTSIFILVLDALSSYAKYHLVLQK